MFHLRLCKGLSYMGIVRATKAEPDVYVPESWDVAFTMRLTHL